MKRTSAPSLLSEIIAGWNARGWATADLAGFRMEDETFSLPENIADLSDEELSGLLEQIAEQADSYEDGSALSDEEISQILALAEAKDTVKAEQTRREEVAQTQAAKTADALARLRGTTDAPSDGEGETVEPAEAEGEQAEAAAVEQTAPSAPAPVATAAVKTPAIPRRTGSLAGVKRPRGTEPARGARKTFMEATGNDGARREGDLLANPRAVAESIVKKRLSFTTVPEGVHGDKISVAHGRKDSPGYEVSAGDAQGNFEVIRDASRTQGEALVASGSSCAPFTPLYDFYRLAEPQSPIEDATPVVQAPRGGVRYVQSPDYTQALAAVGTATLPKPVATVSCPTIADQAVEAVTQIVQFDNLQYRVFPEQVEAFLEDAAVVFALAKEVAYLTYIDSNSTAVTSDIPYGAVGSLLYDWTTATVAFRKRHGMRRGAPVAVMAPDWSLDMIKLDMVENGQQGLDYLNVPDADVEAALRARGIEPVWYNDTLSGGTQKFNSAQAVGGLNPWPATVDAYIHGIGTFVRLDGGTLDVGVVRDSALNKTNDLQIFMEEWLGMIKVAPEAIRLRSIAPCPNGSRALNVSPFSCPIA